MISMFGPMTAVLGFAVVVVLVVAGTACGAGAGVDGLLDLFCSHIEEDPEKHFVFHPAAAREYAKPTPVAAGAPRVDVILTEDDGRNYQEVFESH